MKLKLIIILSLLSLQAVGQNKADTLLLVYKSRIDYCNGKIEESRILKDRILVKDSIIVLLDTRIVKKDLFIESQKRDTEAYKLQIDAWSMIVNKKEGEITVYKSEIKQKDKKIFTLKVIAILSFGLMVWSWASH